METITKEEPLMDGGHSVGKLGNSTWELERVVYSIGPGYLPSHLPSAGNYESISRE